MNWEWLDGIPYFVVTVEWASGKRRKKRVWSRDVQQLEHSRYEARPCCWSMHKVHRTCPCSGDSVTLFIPKHPQPTWGKGRKAPTPPSQHSTQNCPDTTTLMVHTLPSHGRGSRITFFINQFTPSLNTSPPKKEICEGNTAVSSPLRDPSTDALCWQNPKHYVSNFLFWLLELKPMASKSYTWGRKAFIFSSLSIWQHIVYMQLFSSWYTERQKWHCKCRKWPF